MPLTALGMLARAAPMLTMAAAMAASTLWPYISTPFKSTGAQVQRGRWDRRVCLATVADASLQLLILLRQDSAIHPSVVDSRGPPLLALAHQSLASANENIVAA